MSLRPQTSGRRSGTPSSGAGSASLEEFKARLPLVEIVGRHVRLTRRGREYQGLCPFHNEKTPSFSVVEDKGFYHCFGCGQHGNAIDFIMAIEGLEFAEALVRLGELTGIRPPGRTDGGQARAAEPLLAANAAAARWFASRLQTPAGAEALAYLTGRGLTPALIERFGLGYGPPDRRALRTALGAEGFAPDVLVKAGLLVQPDDGGQPFDRFRHRVMFPIHDARGRVVGFGGRALGEAKSKYVNTPDTPLFHKGELLYGFSLARQAARGSGSVIVAEGYMDVIAFARAGLPAVAPLGTAVTEQQLALLWQLADEPIVCLDGDAAGQRAGLRLIERALPCLKPGKSLRFVQLPEGLDPDDLLRQQGADALRAHLKTARPLHELLWDSELHQRVVDTPERRAALRARLQDLTQSIDDPTVRQAFKEVLRELWQARFAVSSGKGGKAGKPQALIPANERGSGRQRLARTIGNPAALAERELIAPILAQPEIVASVEEDLAAVEFSEPQLERMRQEIISWYGELGHLDPTSLSAHLCRHGFASLVEQLSTAGPTAWYRRKDVTTVEVLDGWRARIGQRQQLVAAREGREAMAEAIMGARADEAKVQTLAVDRLLNQEAKKRMRRQGE